MIWDMMLVTVTLVTVLLLIILLALVSRIWQDGTKAGDEDDSQCLQQSEIGPAKVEKVGEQENSLA
ncbi:MAG: hypothetical protein AB7G68_14090 [Nitrospiraceae bacterium]